MRSHFNVASKLHSDQLRSTFTAEDFLKRVLARGPCWPTMRHVDYMLVKEKY